MQSSGLRVHWLAAWAAALALAACGGGGGASPPTPPTAPPAATAAGIVTTPAGDPVSGASVTAYDTNTNTLVVTQTDTTGRYRFENLFASGNVPPTYQLYVEKPGYGFYPALASGGTVIRADYEGLTKTVINFAARPGVTLDGADFIAYDGTDPLIVLPRTGQTTSVRAGDDAASGRGTAWPAARFVDNHDGTITDRLTGLSWLRDAGCVSARNWIDALAAVGQLASGACGLQDGSSAGDWRLPNVNELASLIDVSQSAPALPTGHPFVRVAGIYWSSTTYYEGPDNSLSKSAWAIRSSDGRYMNDPVSNIKATSLNSVWAVKGRGGGTVSLPSTGQHIVFAPGDDASAGAGVALTYPRFIDNANGTVTDTMTGLVWLRMANCVQSTWAGALAATQALASGQCGLTDGSTAGSWRMPNRNELESLSDRSYGNHADYFDAVFTNASQALGEPAIFTGFITGQYYWTSTTDAADPARAWTVYSCDFGVYDTPKTNTGYSLAVR